MGAAVSVDLRGMPFNNDHPCSTVTDHFIAYCVLLYGHDHALPQGNTCRVDCSYVAAVSVMDTGCDTTLRMPRSMQRQTGIILWHRLVRAHVRSRLEYALNNSNYTTVKSSIQLIMEYVLPVLIVAVGLNSKAPYQAAVRWVTAALRDLN